LVKYWEKGQSNPANPSVSFTLNNCKTITKLALLKRKYRYFSFDLLLKEKPKEISNRKSKVLGANQIYLS
jgi:diphosphomevalonate decarboxylase